MTATAPTESAPPALVSPRYRYFVAAAFVTGLIMDILDTTVINVGLPTLGRELHAPNAQLEWVVTGYLLSLAVWIPASGWIGDRFGTKKTFIFALTMFTLSSALCGVSQSINQLIAFRILQGVGGGMMTPVGTAMLFRVFPPQERAKASVFLGVPTLLAPTFGPLLGGWLVDGPGWRWIFYINLPIGIFGILFSLRFLRENIQEHAGRFDLPGFLLSGTGLALVLYAMASGPGDGWGAPNVLGTLAAGIAAFIGMVVFELRTSEPMLDLRLLRDRMFRTSTVTLFMVTAGMLGTLFLLPLYLQQLRGFHALDSGLATFPMALGMGIMLPLSARLYPRVGPRRMMLAGMAITAVSSALLLLVGLDTDLWWIRGNLFLRGAGMSFGMIAIQTATFATIAPRDAGRASSLFSTNRQVASAAGVALLATVLIERVQSHIAAAHLVAGPGAAQAARYATLLGFHDAFFAATILAVLGCAFALLIHDEDAAATMRPGAHPVPAAVE